MSKMIMLSEEEEHDDDDYSLSTAVLLKFKIRVFRLLSPHVLLFFQFEW